MLATITHPHAQTAVLLASFSQPVDRAYVNRELARSGCPRSLYTTACILQAGLKFEQAQDEIESLHRQIIRDFNGANHAQLAERHGISITEAYQAIKASSLAARRANQ